MQPNEQAPEGQVADAAAGNWVDSYAPEGPDLTFASAEPTALLAHGYC